LRLRSSSSPLSLSHSARRRPLVVLCSGLIPPSSLHSTSISFPQILLSSPRHPSSSTLGPSFPKFFWSNSPFNLAHVYHGRAIPFM
jgi:hypothetical protein